MGKKSMCALHDEKQLIKRSKMINRINMINRIDQSTQKVKKEQLF